MEDGIEKEILEEIAKRLVMSKEELFKMVEGKADLATLENVLKSLEEKGYLTKVSPLGSSSFVVTTKGIKAVGTK
jgi:Fe2+ or Zn2+ uptake regulation protein